MKRLSTLFTMLCVSCVALAQDDNADAGIEPQPLNKALEAFADRSGLQVIYVAELAKDKESNGAEPDLSDAETLDQLLASTGLEYAFLNDNTVTVQAVAEDQGGDSDSKNLSPAPILMAQNASNPTQTSVSSRSDEGGTSVVTGRVTDARTGANLRGAKVTIEETGQWTSTGDLGQFRFVSVPTGSVTLTVSFLGYAGQSIVVGVRGNPVSQDFALRGGSELDEIVVFGLRSARALSLNQERTASNFSTVLASDFLGQYEGNTISDVLRRAPGVAFEQDPVTGDGTNIIVRGLEPDFNTVTLNGLRLPEGSGAGRSASLNNILTDSISKVRISKSLLPSQDGSGTGGLVDIETKGPLDRPNRFASVAAQGALRSDDFENEYLLSGTVSGIFGRNEQFGLSASVQYRDQDQERISYRSDVVFGEYLPLNDEGNPVTSIFALPQDGRAFPFDDGGSAVYPRSVSNGVHRAQTKNLTVNFASEWVPSEGTELRLDYTRLEVDTDSYSSSVFVSAENVYTIQPIDELGGEERGALIWEDAFAGDGLPGGLLFNSQGHDLTLAEDRSDILSFDGESAFGNWSVGYSGGYARAKSRSENRAFFAENGFDVYFDPIDLSLLRPEARNNTRNGLVVSPFAPLGTNGYPLILLTDDGFAQFNDPDRVFADSISEVLNEGQNERYTARLNLRREFASKYLHYLDVGYFYETSRFESDARALRRFTIDSLSLTELGLSGSTDNLNRIGLQGGFTVLPEQELRRFYSTIASNDAVEITVPDSQPLAFEGRFTDEDNQAVYFEAGLNFDKLEIVGGARIESVDVTARVQQRPIIIFEDGSRDFDLQDRLSVLVDQQGSQTELLPRVSATYRFSDNMLLSRP